jgi:hypothetical protein
MRVVIQAPVNGAYETVWSAEMLTRANEVRGRKVTEAQALAYTLGRISPDQFFHVGVWDVGAGEAGMDYVLGAHLLAAARRAIVHATRGCLTE